MNDILKDKWESGDYDHLKPLREELLEIDGEEVVPTKYEPQLDKILNSGALMSPSKKEIIDGEDSQCHRNCSVIFQNQNDILGDYDEVKIGTGWALSEGKWRQHSWIIVDSNILIETTKLREKYYGIILEGEEARKFSNKNL
jgi:hypothetical protein